MASRNERPAMAPESQVDIDDLDRRILNELIDDAALSARDLARRLGVAAATILKRVRRLERDGIITKRTIGVKYSRIGYDMQVVIELRIAKGRLHEVEQKIASHPNVFAVYDITGPFDAIVIAKFRARRELDAFLKRIQTYDFVERTETHLLLQTMKEHMIKLPVAGK